MIGYLPMAEAAPVIEVDSLSKSFMGKTVVDNVSLRVRPGEIHGFLGPNGSGKTTFIRMLCGLLRPDSGRGVCLGFDIRAEPEKIKTLVGYMSQNFSLYEDLSVRENLNFMGRIYGLQNLRAMVDESLERLGLDRFAKQLAGTLSGGWKQRLALAACLLHRPRLLLLDEPTAGVDPRARSDFWDEIYRLAADGVTSLISTHYMDEAERCHRLAYLSYGHLLASGTAAEVVASSGLSGWTVSGGNVHLLAPTLKEAEGVEQVVFFGNTLRVCGHDADKLALGLRPFMKGEYLWRKTPPGLDEVFINLMRQHGVS